jgi:hypothetical protein
MSPTLVVLLENGLPDARAWTAEIQSAGLDIEVHPPTQDAPNGGRCVPVSVYGQRTLLQFEGVATLHKEWFPSSISSTHPEGAVALFLWQGNGTALDQAVEWAAVASLARLSAAEVFDGQGLPGKSPEAAYERARELVKELPVSAAPIAKENVSRTVE